MPDAMLEMEISAVLDTLGTTSNAVAQSLKEMGIRGRRGSASSCPIALFLARKGIPGGQACSSRISIYKRDMPGTDPKPVCSVMLFEDSPVRNFIRDFDLQKYPDVDQCPEIYPEPGRNR